MRWTRAPAKVNLTLRVIGRRADGYHDLESLVAFADLCDWLGYEPGAELSLEVVGPRASQSGPVIDNLVARAARALAARLPGLTLGRFRLVKQIPAAAGLGGGSADAAAALRALAEEAGIALDDERVVAAARETGADVPVCLAGRPRMMKGLGDELGPPLPLPPLFALLVNPGVETPTAKVFSALGLAPGERLAIAAASVGAAGSLAAIRAGRNDLEGAALRVAPVIGEVIGALTSLPSSRVARMSGSGATCFALFDDRRAAAAARRLVAGRRPDWWTEATRIR